MIGKVVGAIGNMFKRKKEGDEEEKPGEGTNNPQDPDPDTPTQAKVLKIDDQTLKVTPEFREDSNNSSSFNFSMTEDESETEEGKEEPQENETETEQPVPTVPVVQVPLSAPVQIEKQLESVGAGADVYDEEEEEEDDEDDEEIDDGEETDDGEPPEVVDLITDDEEEEEEAGEAEKFPVPVPKPASIPTTITVTNNCQLPVIITPRIILKLEPQPPYKDQEPLPLPESNVEENDISPTSSVEVLEDDEDEVMEVDQEEEEPELEPPVVMSEVVAEAQVEPEELKIDDEEEDDESNSTTETELVGGVVDVDQGEVFIEYEQILDNEITDNMDEEKMIEIKEDSESESEDSFSLEPESTNQITQKVQEEKKPAWHDSDDDISDTEGVHTRHPGRKTRKYGLYRQRLIEQFQLVHGIPSWSVKKSRKVVIDSDDEEEGDETDEIKRVGVTKSKKFMDLKPGQIKIVKVLNLNNEGHLSREFIRSIKFHPKSQVALVAGSSDVVSLYQVDGKSNSRIQTVKFERFGLRNAIFGADGNEFYVSSPARGYFYSYDMLSGKINQVKPNFSNRHETIRKLYASPNNEILVGLGHHGNMSIYSQRSKEIIGTLKMNGEVQDLTFDSTGRQMFSTGALGEIYEWDMDRRACIGKFQDDGALIGTSIRLTQDYLVTGSDTGVVNLYEKPISSHFPKPIKSFMNLTTRVTCLETNHSGELAAFGSYEKRDILKLAHLHSKTVYSNFPFVNTTWGRPNTMAFSPNSGFFSFGNERGEAYLFRLTHFDNY